MSTIKMQNNRKTVQQRTAEGTTTRPNNGVLGGSKCTNHSRPLWYNWCRAISGLYRLGKTSCKQSRRGDLHPKWLNRETNNDTFYYASTTINNSNLFFRHMYFHCKSGNTIRFTSKVARVHRAASTVANDLSLRSTIVALFLEFHPVDRAEIFPMNRPQKLSW